MPSPNSGWSEAACTGALRVRLLGPLYRGGMLVSDRFLGAPEWPAVLDGSHLRSAFRLILTAAVLALAIGSMLSPLRWSMPW